MADYLVIKANNSTKSYECKSTHTSVPYIKVNTGYLDLTTETTAGLQCKVKVGNSTYRPKQIYITTTTRSSEYTETTGYTGVSSRSSTSGYTGVSSSYQNKWTGTYKISISQKSVVYNTTEAGHSPQLGRYTRAASTTNFIRSSSTTTTLFSPYTTVFTQSITSAAQLKNSSTTSQEMVAAMALINRYYNTFETQMTATSKWGSIPRHVDINMTTYSSITSHLTSTIKSSSVAVGNLSSTTALTRSSAYNTSSNTTNAGISSTTALTKTNSRSSQYNTITEL